MVTQLGSDEVYGSHSVKVEEDSQRRLREFLSKMGIDVTPPRAIFGNCQDGTLLCRGTLRDLDIVDLNLEDLFLEYMKEDGNGR